MKDQTKKTVTVGQLVNWRFETKAARPGALMSTFAAMTGIRLPDYSTELDLENVLSLLALSPEHEMALLVWIDEQEPVMAVVEAVVNVEEEE